MSPLVASGAEALDEWRFTAVGGIEPYVIAILCTIALLAVTFTFRSLDPRLPVGSRIAITVLRASVLALALAMLAQPVLQMSSSREATSRLAVLVDVSGSMQQGGERSRLSEIRRVLEKARPGLERLARRHRLAYYRFADELREAAGPAQALEPEPGASGTDIFGALASLAAAHGDGPLAGVILMSDGADTGSLASGESEPTSWLDKLAAPVNVVAVVGSTSGAKDLAIVEVKADSIAFSRSPTSIAVKLRARNLPDGEQEVLLGQDGSILQRRAIRLVGGEGQTAFAFSPSRLGRHVMEVTAPEPAGDEIPENNRAYIAFDVLRDKFRVLHLAGRPSWDQRFLRDALRSWPRADVVSFYILRSVHQSVSPDPTGLALIPFPTQEIFEEHLEEFDVILFQDFEPAAHGVDRYIPRVVEFVRRGGAVAVVGGDIAFGPAGAGGGALAEILPVKPLPPETPQRDLADESPFRPRLTEAGERHPVTRLFPEASENAVRFRSLFRLDGIARVAGPAKGAVVLAEHPFVRSEDGPSPVIAVRQFEKGRTLAVTTDSLWRWRFSGPMEGGPPDVLPDFWRRAMAWLTSDPEFDRLRADVTPSPVHLGGSATLNVELLDESYEPVAGATVECRLTWLGRNGREESETFQARLDDRGRYRREWTPRVAGPHTFIVSTAAGENARVRFLVDPAGREILHLEADEALLRSVAEASGGTYSQGSLDVDALKLEPPGLREIRARRDYSLWDSPLAILLVVALLTAEWTLRRRLGLR